MNNLHKLNQPVVAAIGLSKVYCRGREEVRALDNATLQIHRGEFVAIVGPSGSGKTSLLNLIGCMDAPTAGKLQLLGVAVEEMTEGERTRFRRERMGFVFQHFGLMPALTVAENVTMPLFLSGKKDKNKIHELLERVGMWHRRDHRPHELSGGEMQRAAIARALVNNPQLLLADEPTGNLDQESGTAITELFSELNREGLTILVVTHNTALAQVADRQIEIRDGCLSSVEFRGIVSTLICR